MLELRYYYVLPRVLLADAAIYILATISPSMHSLLRLMRPSSRWSPDAPTERLSSVMAGTPWKNDLPTDNNTFTNTFMLCEDSWTLQSPAHLQRDETSMYRGGRSEESLLLPHLRPLLHSSLRHCNLASVSITCHNC